MMPFKVVYGRQPPSLIYYGDRVITNSTLDEQLKKRDVSLEALQENMHLTQDQMKKYAD